MKELLLIRHGEADHNVLFAQNRSQEAQELRDPNLNRKGIQQAKDLKHRLSNFLRRSFDLELVITSPMRRTLETYDLVLSTTRCPVIISPLPREQGDFPCDYGSNRSDLETEFPHHNFSDLEEVWWTEDETYPQVQERVEEFKRFLNERPEKNIAVVSHGVFLKALVRSTEQFRTFRSFKNCECLRATLDQEGSLNMII